MKGSQYLPSGDLPPFLNAVMVLDVLCKWKPLVKKFYLVFRFPFDCVQLYNVGIKIFEITVVNPTASST